MSRENLSRRRFLSDVAAGSTGAALATLPGVLPPAAGAGAGMPLTMESYPIVEAGKGAALDRITILTAEGIAAPDQEKIRGLASGIELKVSKSEDEFRRQAADAHVIYGGFLREDLAAAKQLRWIQWTAAGVESILWPELVESPVVLTNMQRIYSPVISESAIGLILALARGFPQYTLQTREHRWQTVPGLVEISGMTLGLVG